MLLELIGCTYLGLGGNGSNNGWRDNLVGIWDSTVSDGTSMISSQKSEVVDKVLGVGAGSSQDSSENDL